MPEGLDNGVLVLRRARVEPRLLVCAHVFYRHSAQPLAIGNPSRRRHKTVAVADPMLDLLVGGRCPLSTPWGKGPVADAAKNVPARSCWLG
jgi:hypothetical protein